MFFPFIVFISFISVSCIRFLFLCAHVCDPVSLLVISFQLFYVLSLSCYVRNNLFVLLLLRSLFYSKFGYFIFLLCCFLLYQHLFIYDTRCGALPTKPGEGSHRMGQICPVRCGALLAESGEGSHRMGQICPMRCGAPQPPWNAKRNVMNCKMHCFSNTS